VVDDDPTTGFGRNLRLRLNREHLERGDGDDADLLTTGGVFAAYGEAARRLDDWYAAGRHGPRPSGRLRRYAEPVLPLVTAALADPMYRLIADPDGRPRPLRRAHVF